MPPEMSEHGGESSSVDAPGIANAGAAVDRDGKSRRQILRRRPSHQRIYGLRGGENC